MHTKIFIFAFICCSYCVGDSSDSSNRQDDSHGSEECQGRYALKNCSDLSNLCLDCKDYDKHTNCRYGEWLNVTCTIPENIACIRQMEENDVVIKRARCLYCYQTENWEQTCLQKSSCIAIQTPNHYYKTNCTVNSDVMCIGNRRFLRKLKCNWTRGHKWSTALLLSITLGGFGADRFYLGHWQEGIGKLFSFGGLGVWTLVDVLLIAIRYLGPADGSFYV